LENIVCSWARSTIEKQTKKMHHTNGKLRYKERTMTKDRASESLHKAISGEGGRCARRNTTSVKPNPKGGGDEEGQIDEGRHYKETGGDWLVWNPVKWVAQWYEK